MGRKKKTEEIIEEEIIEVEEEIEDPAEEKVE